MKTVNFGSVIKSFLVLCLIAVSAQFALAQRPTGAPQPDVLQGLKHALSDAGAPALSSAQEDALEALITAYRQSQQGQNGPPEAITNARRAYDAAILAGNLVAAQAQATIIANAISSNTAAHLQAQAKFEIDALNVLKTNPAQVTALAQRVGTAGLTRLLGSLAGGGDRGGFGGPGGQGFPGGPGGQGGPQGGGRPSRP